MVSCYNNLCFYYSGSHKAFFHEHNLRIHHHAYPISIFPPFHLLCLTVKTFFPLDHFYFYSIFKYLTLCIHVKFRTEKWEQTYDICLIKTDLTQYAYLELFILYAHFNEVDDCFPLSFSSCIISNNLSNNSDLSLSHLKN